MAIELIEDEEGTGNLTTQPAATQEPAQTQATPVEDDLPEKYRGKSIKDIVAMHQEAEKVIGRQGQDLGQLRRVTDEYIKASLQRPAMQPQATPQKPQNETKDDEDLEYFTNPKKAIEKALAEHPLVKQLQQKALGNDQEKAVAALNRDHPDWKEVLNDSNFQGWIGKSPVRRALFAQAHRRFDMTAANELLSTWKELKAAKTPAAPTAPAPNTEARKQANQRNLSAAKVPSGNAAPDSGAGGKPIFRRTDLMRLMNEQPDKYEAMQAEIVEAYKDGRVR